jgi:hypothetical protein
MRRLRMVLRITMLYAKINIENECLEWYVKHIRDSNYI